MSEHHSNSPTKIQTKLQICLLATQRPLADSVVKLLDDDCYELNSFNLLDDLIDFALKSDKEIDCLILSLSDQLSVSLKQLWQAEILLPTVIIEAKSANYTAKEIDLGDNLTELEVSDIYHPAEVRLYPTQLKEINAYIQLAINKFISLAAKSESEPPEPAQIELGVKKSLIAQQRRLTDKLKQRLSYMGFFYKRDPDAFWLNLAPEQQQELDGQIRQSYRQILLTYFEEDVAIERLIDEFVERAFFADISTSQILEIHMDLIDDFAYQLKIEGRSDDILLDYRLPLIDIVSHLCEIYRRSIPESDYSMNLLFAVE
ncbi:MAG: circadian clock protein KaiA [Cyanobacteria bacterium J06623_7]